MARSSTTAGEPPGASRSARSPFFAKWAEGAAALSRRLRRAAPSQLFASSPKWDRRLVRMQTAVLGCALKERGVFRLSLHLGRSKNGSTGEFLASRACLEPPRSLLSLAGDTARTEGAPGATLRLGRLERLPEFHPVPVAVLDPGEATIALVLAL